MLRKPIGFHGKLLEIRCLYLKTGYLVNLFSKTYKDTLVLAKRPNSLLNLEFPQLSSWYWSRLAAGDDAVDHAVFQRRARFKNIIAVNVTGDFVDRLTRGVGQNFI